MDFKKVTCYGSGLIGTGWATNFLMAGLEVSLYDVSEDSFDSVREHITADFNFFVKEGVYTQQEVDGFISNLTMTIDPVVALKDTDFVQENGPENMELKQEIVKVIEANIRPDVIVASSTSGLLISDIASKAKHPERFIGGHPYNPVFLIPVVELSKGEKTDEAVLQKAYGFYMEIGKEPIILQKEALGFISNRLQAAVMREAIDMIMRGVCSLEEIDRAVCYGPGLRWSLMGPNAVFQLAGGPYGIGGALKHMGPSMEMWLDDMAKWSKIPDEFKDNVQDMMDDAMAKRDDLHGHTSEEMMDFRNKGLVMLLKYHGKF